jgi:hypothetical protein
MKLEPVRTRSEPRYPTYHRNLEVLRWLKGAAAAGATSLVIALGGCNGCAGNRTAGEPPPVDHQTEVLGGVLPPVEHPNLQDQNKPPPDPPPPPPPPPPEEVRLGGAIARPVPPTQNDTPKPPEG